MLNNGATRFAEELRSRQEQASLLEASDDDTEETQTQNFRVDINSQESLLNEPDNRGRNIRGLILAAMVIVFIFLLVGFASYKMEGKHINPIPQPERLDFQRVIMGTYYASGTDCEWYANNKLLCKDTASKDYYVQTFKSSKSNAKDDIVSKELLLPMYVIQQAGSCWSCTVYFSQNLKYAIVQSEKEQVFRHSYTAEYHVIKISAEESYPVRQVTVDGQERFRYVSFDKGNSNTTSSLLVFTGSTIRYFEDPMSPKFVTVSNAKTDSPNVWSGIPDWVYEEEVLEDNEAFWTSEDGRYLAWGEFQDKDVQKIQIPRYYDYKHPYPEQLEVSYPKPGTMNPECKLFVTNLKDGSSVELKAPKSMYDKDTKHALLFHVQFMKDNSVLATWSNRIQSDAETLLCNPKKGTCELYHARTTNSKGWLDKLTLPYTELSNGMTTAVDFCDNYSGITDIKSGGCFSPPGLHVDKVLSVSTNGLFYSALNTSLVDNKMVGSHVYFFDTVTNDVKSDVESFTTCVTCGKVFKAVSKKPCDNWEVHFSSEGNYATVDCDGPGIPYSVLARIDDIKKDFKLVSVLEENTRLRDTMKKTYTASRVYFKVKLGGNEFSARLLAPFSFIDDAKRSIRHMHGFGGYPLLLNVYAGPGQVKVNSKYSVFYHDWLVTRRNLVVMEVDGRGSYAGNVSNLHSVYRNLGDFEIKDQIEAVKQALDKYPQLNPNKVAIWGWSYGGYTTLRALTEYTHRDPTIFSCGASVAPVADWRLYDTAYTERFMDLPKNNKQNYDASSMLATQRIKKLATYDGKYLLVHGSMDDNVHFQQTALLESRMVDFDVKHRVQFYTDKTHSLSGYHTRMHLYNLLTEFFCDCFEIDNVDSEL